VNESNFDWGSDLKTNKLLMFSKFHNSDSEFLLEHSNLSLTKQGALDKYLRKFINRLIGGLKITKETFNRKGREVGWGIQIQKSIL
jgi:hypothetical protein